MTAQEFEDALYGRARLSGDITRLGDAVRVNGLYRRAMEVALRDDDTARDGQPKRVNEKTGGVAIANGSAAFRAAWALEKAYFADRNAFRPYLGEFIDGFILMRNPSGQRHYAKMLCDMMMSEMVSITGNQAESIAEYCFDLLVASSTRVAVKIWTLEILAMLARHIDWLRDNLREVLMAQMQDCSPALTSRGRKLLRQLG